MVGFHKAYRRATVIATTAAIVMVAGCSTSPRQYDLPHEPRMALLEKSCAALEGDLEIVAATAGGLGQGLRPSRNNFDFNCIMFGACVDDINWRVGSESEITARREATYRIVSAMVEKACPLPDVKP